MRDREVYIERETERERGRQREKEREREERKEGRTEDFLWGDYYVEILFYFDLS